MPEHVLSRVVPRSLFALSGLLGLFLAAAAAPPVHAGPIPGNAVAISQLDYRDSSNTTANYNALRAEFSINFDVLGGSGYVNVVDPVSGEWLVQNLPVNQSFLGGITSISTHMDLTYTGVSAGTKIGSTNLVIDYSNAASTSAAEVLGPTRYNFGVNGAANFALAPTNVGRAIGGTDPVGTIESVPGAPGFAGIVFNAALQTTGFLQGGHPNIQAGYNQCAPAAIANSLQYLENQGAITVLHNNVPGFGADGTLVGNLDVSTARILGANRASRTSSGVWPLKGTLDYMAANGLSSGVQVKHRMGGGADINGNPVSGAANYTSSGLTSLGVGTDFSTDWIITELQRGAAVSGDLAYHALANGAGQVIGRHYVEVVGAGYIFGVPYTIHLSDTIQADWPFATGALGDFFGTTDAFGKPNYFFELQNGSLATGSNARWDQFISVSAAPEPGTLAFLAFGIAGGVLARRRIRRSR